MGWENWIYITRKLDPYIAPYAIKSTPNRSVPSDYRRQTLGKDCIGKDFLEKKTSEAWAIKANIENCDSIKRKLLDYKGMLNKVKREWTDGIKHL